MPIKLTAVTKNAQTTEIVRLHHGTILASALNIQEGGLNYEQNCIVGGTGQFWATTDPQMAAWFAPSNQYAQDHPTCELAMLTFDVSARVINTCLEMAPPGAEIYNDERIQFEAISFDLLNESMANVRVEIIG